MKKLVLIACALAGLVVAHSVEAADTDTKNAFIKYEGGTRLLVRPNLWRFGAVYQQNLFTFDDELIYEPIPIFYQPGEKNGYRRVILQIYLTNRSKGELTYDPKERFVVSLLDCNNDYWLPISLGPILKIPAGTKVSSTIVFEIPEELAAKRRIRFQFTTPLSLETGVTVDPNTFAKYTRSADD